MKKTIYIRPAYTNRRPLRKPANRASWPLTRWATGWVLLLSGLGLLVAGYGLVLK